MDEDTSAYNARLEARRLPNGTPAEKAARAAAIQQGLKTAIAVPWSTAQACMAAMEASELALLHGNPASSTDALVGIALAHAGVQGGVWNVLINLKDLTDESYKVGIREACGALLGVAAEVLARATAYGQARI